MSYIESRERPGLPAGAHSRARRLLVDEQVEGLPRGASGAEGGFAVVVRVSVGGEHRPSKRDGTLLFAPPNDVGSSPIMRVVMIWIRLWNGHWMFQVKHANVSTSDYVRSATII